MIEEIGGLILMVGYVIAKIVMEVVKVILIMITIGLVLGVIVFVKAWREGVIDAGYTGSIMVKLYNSSDVAIPLFRGDKIIQLVLLPIYTPEIEKVDSLDETERGDNGFGSTGR